MELEGGEFVTFTELMKKLWREKGNETQMSTTTFIPEFQNVVEYYLRPDAVQVLGKRVFEVNDTYFCTLDTAVELDSMFEGVKVVTTQGTVNEQVIYTTKESLEAATNPETGEVDAAKLEVVKQYHLLFAPDMELSDRNGVMHPMPKKAKHSIEGTVYQVEMKVPANIIAGLLADVYRRNPESEHPATSGYGSDGKPYKIISLPEQMAWKMIWTELLRANNTPTGEVGEVIDIGNLEPVFE